MNSGLDTKVKGTGQPPVPPERNCGHGSAVWGAGVNLFTRTWQVQSAAHKARPEPRDLERCGRGTGLGEGRGQQLRAWQVCSRIQVVPLRSLPRHSPSRGLSDRDGAGAGSVLPGAEGAGTS